MRKDIFLAFSMGQFHRTDEKMVVRKAEKWEPVSAAGKMGKP
jgi:hypothetical protein